MTALLDICALGILRTEHQRRWMWVGRHSVTERRSPSERWSQASGRPMTSELASALNARCSVALWRLLAASSAKAM